MCICVLGNMCTRTKIYTNLTCEDMSWNVRTNFMSPLFFNYRHGLYYTPSIPYRKVSACPISGRNVINLSLCYTQAIHKFVYVLTLYVLHREKCPHLLTYWNTNTCSNTLPRFGRYFYECVCTSTYVPVWVGFCYSYHLWKIEVRLQPNLDQRCNRGSFIR